jgi:hypothetical protein
MFHKRNINLPNLSGEMHRWPALLCSLLLAACGGGGAGGGGGGQLYNNAPGSAPGVLTPAPPANGSNRIAISVDAGPVPGVSQINIPYVSVTVCTPGTSGTTAACQTIDHVTVDTGSSGLRLLKSALYSNLNLPQVTSGRAAIGECVPFAIGTTWGSVRYADIYLGGEVARSVPIQDIGDQPGGAAAVPVDCSGTGAVQDSQALLGANGILGVGPFKNDCDQCLSALPPLPAAYYTCNSSGCTNADVTAAQVVQNPVADFAMINGVQDNNGVLISLGSVPAAGATNSLAGQLVFGIATQTDNQLGSAAVYAADQYGNIQTAFNGTTMPSFIDSGSNALYFADASLAMCTVNTMAYCPVPSPLTLSASNMSAGATSGTAVSFSIVGADTLSTGIIAASIAAGNPYQQFDWGLPFFFNRTIFTAISGASVATSGVPAIGPFFAY